MTKAQYATLIMENTNAHKKSHLAKMHIADLAELAAPYITAEAPGTASETEESAPVMADAALPVNDTQDATPAETPECEESVVQATQEGKTEQPKPKRQYTPKDTINDREKTLLSMIPGLADFKDAGSEMGGRALLKKAQELHGYPLNIGRALFASLKSKGYYSTKGKEAGQNLTTFQLSEQGIQYLTDNGLLAVV